VKGRFVFDRAPARVYWETTRACDLACRHCRAHAVPTAHRGELTTAEGRRLLDDLARFEAPLPHVVFTGGDPLKRSDLFELIEYARMRGLGVSVAPSGAPLLTAVAIGALKAAGTEAISLSLDGATAARHDALRGVPGCFDRTLAAAAARAAALPFQVNTLVSAETLDDLPAIHRLATELRAARFSLFFLVSVGRGTVLEQITPEQLDGVLQWLAGFAGTGPPIVTTTEAPQFRRLLLEGRQGAHVPGAGVRDGNGIVFVSHTGDITPSGFMPLAAGNVRSDDIVAVYRHSPLFRRLREADDFGGRCGSCDFRAPCGGSRARAFAASGDPFGEDPLCAYEPATIGR
jgi:MoaA/NifB/PqqE/SkfB family radical SAM enzyme